MGSFSVCCTRNSRSNLPLRPGAVCDTIIAMKLSDLFSNYFEVRTEMTDGTRALTEKQLAWTPANHPNSIGHLLAHIAEAECWWISIIARKSITEDDADLKGFEDKMSTGKLFDLLEEYFGETRLFLEANNTSTWDTIMYDVPGRSKPVSLRWLAWHVVEHQARHRGQIFMLMRMQGLDVPNV